MEIEDIALAFTPGLGVKGCVHLLETFGSARGIFTATAEELTGKAELRPDIARSILARNGFAAAEKEMAHCRRHGMIPIASTDRNYPPLLREIPDYPHVIYVQGDPTTLCGTTISMVGTRGRTSYGERMCRELVAGLVERVPGLCVVSGLAFGIDGDCHRAALACGAATIAVLANALPGVTPSAHASLAREILASGGALVTELHSRTRQNGSFFLARNRIIAALSAGTIVVESGSTGGSLVTAQYADSYDRTVMAVPGRTIDTMSAGTNALIRNRKAQLILTAADVIREMGWDLDPQVAAAPAARPPLKLTRDERGLLGCFRDDDPQSAEELAASADSARAKPSLYWWDWNSRAPCGNCPETDTNDCDATDRHPFTRLRRGVRRRPRGRNRPVAGGRRGRTVFAGHRRRILRAALRDLSRLPRLLLPHDGAAPDVGQ